MAAAAARLGAEFRGRLGRGRRRPQSRGPGPCRAASAPCPVGPPPGTPWTTRPRRSWSICCGGPGSTGWPRMRRGPTIPCSASAGPRPTRCARRCGLDPVDDPSNTDRRFVRNRVRHELLPWPARSPGATWCRVLARQAGVLADEAELLDELAAGIDPSDANALGAAPDPIARRAGPRGGGCGDPRPTPRTWPRWSGSWLWPGDSCGPPRSPRACGCDGPAGTLSSEPIAPEASGSVGAR